MKRLHYADWNEVRITLTVKDIADVLNVCDTVALNGCGIQEPVCRLAPWTVMRAEQW